MTKLLCPYCDRAAELVGGKVIYPHRPDLFDKRFWRCEPCQAWVGCHPPGSMGDGTMPLGRLANAELRRLKSAAHAAFDPLWKSRRMKRRDAYGWLATDYGAKQVTIFNTAIPSPEAEFAMHLIERFGLIAGTEDGEDSAGRRAMKLLPAQEVVDRSFEIARLTFSRIAETGMFETLPDLNKVNSAHDAKMAREEAESEARSAKKREAAMA